MSEPVEQLSRGAPALRLHRELAAIWSTGPGLQRLAAVNHSVIGLRMMITSFVFFAIAGVLGMLTRVQLATPKGDFMDPETYNQVFTMHGSMMLFLFAIPMGLMSMATVTLHLVTTPVTTVAKHHSTPRGFGSGLSHGWHAFAASIAWLLTAIGAGLPFLVLLALVFGAYVLIRRRLADQGSRSGPPNSPATATPSGPGIGE